jgi:hypothetical protein
VLHRANGTIKRARLPKEDMKKNLTLAITSVTILAALTITVRLAAQEPQDESATTSAASPVPLINQPLVPDAIKPGSIGFTLTVNGSGLVTGSKVEWNGSVRTTTFVSRSQLKASIVATDVVKPTAAKVTVFNPAPGGGN